MLYSTLAAMIFVLINGANIYTTVYYACLVAIMATTGIFITVFRKQIDDYFGVLVV